MPFLSYRRATNERTVRPSFPLPLPPRVLFILDPLCFVRGTGVARIHVADHVISDCRDCQIDSAPADVTRKTFQTADKDRE
jgi:hypothetical protein